MCKPLIPATLCRVPEDCPQAVMELIDACLALEPDARPTAALCVEVLEQSLQVRPPSEQLVVMQQLHEERQQGPGTSASCESDVSASRGGAYRSL